MQCVYIPYECHLSLGSDIAGLKSNCHVNSSHVPLTAANGTKELNGAIGGISVKALISM